MIVFGELLDYLRQEGFVIGVEHYLRLQTLLNKIDDGRAPKSLKTLLCPIFATTANEQKRFYEVFDNYLTLVQTKIKISARREDEIESQKDGATVYAQRTSWRRLYKPGGIFLLIAIFAISLFIVSEPSQEPNGSLGNKNSNENRTTNGGQILGSGNKNSPTGNNSNSNRNDDLTGIPIREFYWVSGSIVRLIVVFLPALLALYWEWRRFRHRKLVLQKQKGKTPPFTWPIKFEKAQPSLYTSKQFHTAVRLMRQRQENQFYRLNIDATIDATIKLSGYPSLRYKADTKLPEYLILIDCASSHDHQASLFDHLATCLMQEGVHINRLFYRGDPRVCYREFGTQGIRLADIHREFASHRLLIFGNGAELIDPMTGQLADWCSLFSDWRDRAILTPSSADDWGFQELALESQFKVFPATVNGLIALIEHFDLAPMIEHHNKGEYPFEALPTDLNNDVLVEALRDHLGEECFHWLCRSAIYSELHWDLTLSLGSLSRLEKPVATEKNILRLVRLPWFRRGSLPDDLRWRLIKELDSEEEAAARSAIIHLLSRNLPPEGIFAADARQMDIVVQRWLLRHDRHSYLDLSRVVETVPQGQALRDYTLLRFLKSRPSSFLDIILPDQFRTLFFNNKFSLFGIRPIIRILTILVLIALGFGLAYQSNWFRTDRITTQLFVSTEITAEVSHLSDGDRKALDKIIQASKLMDDIFYRQVWSGNDALKKKLESDQSPLGQQLLRYFVINKGPWSRLTKNEPFIEGVPHEKPPQAGFYPDDITKDEFNAWAQGLSEDERKKAVGFFYTIRRGDDRKLKTVAYSQEYREFLERASRLLGEAATLTTNETLKNFLTKRAEAFMSDNYYASDVAWMDLDAPVDVTIGPYETYEDELFGYKAAFEAFVALRDDTESAKIAKFSNYLQELEDNLPIEARYRNPKLGAASPIRVVDVVFAAGDGNRGVQTAAFNLPNDEQVVKERGSKRVMLKNMQEAKFNKVLVPISAIVLVPSQRSQISFDAFFTHILAHELLHGIGPHSITVGGRQTTVRLELKELASTIEEAKADITGLWGLQYLIDKGAVDKKLEGDLYTTYLASSFRSVRFGTTEAHGKGQALQFNYLLDEGGIKYDPQAGTYAIDPARIKDAVRKLTTEILMLQAEGSYEKAKALLDKYGVIRPNMQKALDKLGTLPVDIEPRFTLAESPSNRSE